LITPHYEYGSFGEFIGAYKKLAKEKAKLVKGTVVENKRLNFDFSFNPGDPEKWKLAVFKDRWENLDL